MKYRIMIVEDEPPSMRNIEKCILGCGVPDLEIAARAYNGREALDMLGDTSPHIIFSDVKMPVMDGFAFVEEVKKLRNAAPIVILSGYQEFGYVKKALQYELFDYLLKPIDRQELQKTLNRLKQSVDKSIYQGVGRYLRACVDNPATAGPPETNGRCYRAAMFNFGPYLSPGSPQEFAPSHMPGKNDIYACLSDSMPSSDVWILETASINRVLAVAEDGPWSAELERLLAKCFAGYKGAVTVAHARAQGLADMPEAIQRVRDRVARALIPNRTQIIGADGGFAVPLPPAIKRADEKRLLALLEEKRFPSFAQALEAALAATIDGNSTQESLARLFSSIVALLQKRLDLRSGEEMALLESIGGEALVSGRDAAGITEEYTARLLEFLSERGRYSDADPTTEDVIEKIAGYLREHFCEEIEFKSLALRFGVSPAYLSTLFRKYVGAAPTKYLIRLRIDRAREIMAQDSSVPLRQVANLVGYDDPHYFSRVFRNIEGISPSEYRLKLEQLGSESDEIM